MDVFCFFTEIEMTSTVAHHTADALHLLCLIVVLHLIATARVRLRWARRVESEIRSKVCCDISENHLCTADRRVHRFTIGAGVGAAHL